MSDRPTKFQALGSSMFLSTIVNGLVIAFVVWIAGKAVHVDPIISELEKMNKNIENLYTENKDYHINNIQGHMHINQSIGELTSHIKIVEHQTENNSKICSEHLKNPKIHLGRNHDK